MINDIKERRKRERGTSGDEDEAKRIACEGRSMRNM
jgi:hypothetical protein